ncbi:hypothetical protein MID00_16560 [Alcaligenes sp. NLF5-7]|uniref:XopAX family type III secretion system effector n=1 Tax=Alcaligenes sp. NLF5-7 TaxID=2918755 RepID=UPI0020C34289|nr:XopAX family type III secretion system effector [Alcaligenes sp. NLF5-7]UTM01089.1 hypothetical protein MID00_16560 [Alcaligenes sp. NLF5-7]
MRITNKNYTPLGILAELLAYSPSTDEGTNRFSEKELSSHTYLLSALRERLETILNFFERLGCESSENQGLDDNGVDLLLRFESSGESRRVGFQIKSNREADNAAKIAQALKQKSPKPVVDPEDTLLKTLKRQAHEARLETKVDEWWVLPCFDFKKHKGRFTAINAHFNNHPDLRWPVRVVPPQQILGLLEMSLAEIDAVCTLLLCRDDEVLNASRNEFGNLSGAAQNFIRETFYSALVGEVTVEDRDFFDAVRGDEDRPDVGELFEELECCGYVKRACVEENHNLYPHAFPGLCALYFEGRVRHDLKPSQASTFVWRLLEDVQPAPEVLQKKD